MTTPSAPATGPWNGPAGSGVGEPSAYDDAQDVLALWQAPTPEQDRLRIEFLAHLAAHEDGLERGCFPDHVTAGTLVVSADRQRVLLNLHRKAGRWFAFGGHLEPGDHTLAGAALREAREESGIDGLVLGVEPAQLDIHEVEFCDARGTVRHLDVRFIAVAPPGAEPRVSGESLDVRWFAAHEAPTDEPSMRALIDRAVSV